MLMAYIHLVHLLLLVLDNLPNLDKSLYPFIAVVLVIVIGFYLDSYFLLGIAVF
jgi:hypothetical protein